MKKASSFLCLWIIWAILALIEAYDSGECYSAISALFAALGLTILFMTIYLYPLIFGWSWWMLMFGISSYLLIGIIFNERTNSEFGHRVFP